MLLHCSKGHSAALAQIKAEGGANRAPEVGAAAQQGCLIHYARAYMRIMRADTCAHTYNIKFVKGHRGAQPDSKGVSLGPGKGLTGNTLTLVGAAALILGVKFCYQNFVASP